jgi:precorrin-6B methylase 2
VRTFGYHPANGKPGDDDWRVHYDPTPYSDIFRLLRLVELRNHDVFADLGAGMGRAVFAASWMGARRAVGIEIVQNLCNKATQNYRQSRLANRDIEFICASASNYWDHDTTILFMFHPFGEATLRQVLRNIEASRRKGTRHVLRVVYLNPVFDLVLQQTGWLRRMAHVPATARWPSTAKHYAATLWEALP